MLGIDKIKITPEILARACEIDEFKGYWRGLEQHTTSLQLLGEVAEFGPRFRAVFDPLKEQELTPEMLCILHASQVKGPSPSPYKLEDNQLEIRSDGDLVGVLDTASPDQVAPLLDKLVDWLNDALEDGKLHPLITIAVFASIFMQISPFKDGQLRTVRFLILLLMLRCGYTYAPYVPLDRIMNERAEMIYSALDHNQNSLESGMPEWSVWLRCFFMILQDQTRILKARVEKKDGEIANMPDLSMKIISAFESSGFDRLQMNEIVRLTRGRRSTIKLRLNELVEGGYLRRHGKARSTWYSRI